MFFKKVQVATPVVLSSGTNITNNQTWNKQYFSAHQVGINDDSRI